MVRMIFEDSSVAPPLKQRAIEQAEDVQYRRRNIHHRRITYRGEGHLWIFAFEGLGCEDDWDERVAERQVSMIGLELLRANQVNRRLEIRILVVDERMLETPIGKHDNVRGAVMSCVCLRCWEESRKSTLGIRIESF